MADFDRRKALGLITSSALAAGCVSGSSGRAGADADTDTSGGAIAQGRDTAALKDLAAAKGIRFGSAMATHQLDDPQYVAIMQRDCATMVAENAHKMYTLQPVRGQWNWTPADRLVAFARSNNIRMRGHAAVWHHPRWMPDWVNNATFTASEAERVLGDYITGVVGRYDPFLYSWDVINESVADEDGTFRETSFSRAMGGTVNALDFSFRMAREAAPGCSLAYNDYMSWETTSTRHRAGVLRLMEALMTRGTPIDAIGLQSHSNYEMPDAYDRARERDWIAFLDELKGMGFRRFYLTEFDVNDTGMGPDVAARDAAIASYTKDYLDLMFSYRETRDLLVWGMVDSMSWLQGFLPREDGVEKRPALYDSRYRPKIMRDAVASALRAAPERDYG